jgi:hypothetical protein
MMHIGDIILVLELTYSYDINFCKVKYLIILIVLYVISNFVGKNHNIEI